MTGPLVSVVVPVHEGERFLARALVSALAQDHRPLEVVVVDDGSSDGSAEIAASHPVRLLRQPNRGVAAARNAGVSASKGELLAFLDQDDEWLPHKLSRQVAVLAERPDVGFVVTRMQIVLEPGTPRPDWLPEGWLREDSRGVVPSALMVRREVFEQVGEFDSEYEFACDADWLARAKDAGVRWSEVDEVLVRYRIHGDNGIYRREAMHRELLTSLRASMRRQRGAPARGAT
jgi:glycosyltransferase involved in cell wall biosynthesis